MEIAIPVTTSHTEYLNKRANGEPVYKINAPRRHIKETRSPKTRITKLYEELLKYKQPICQGRQNERNIKPKSAVAFGYRVA